MTEYVKVANEGDILPGRCRAYEVNGVKIVLFNSAGEFYALEDSCSHLGAPLSSGFPGKNSISCEWHGATFDIRTGEALSAPASTPVQTFRVRKIDGIIEVEL